MTRLAKKLFETYEKYAGGDHTWGDIGQVGRASWEGQAEILLSITRKILASGDDFPPVTIPEDLVSLEPPTGKKWYDCQKAADALLIAVGNLGGGTESGSREKSLAITRLQEGMMWANRIFSDEELEKMSTGESIE